MAEAVSKDDAIEDLQRVAQKLNTAPTVAEYREHGDYSIPTITKWFDGFPEAREAAGIAKGQLTPNSREDYLNDIQRVAELVNGEPSKDDYKEYGEKSPSGIEYRFESWVDAKKEAGVYEGLDEGPSKADLLEDMRRVDNEIDEPLSQKRYDKHGEWTSRSVKWHFPSWEMACQKARVSRPQFGPQPVSDAEVVEDIQRVRDDLGHYPSKVEYNELGKFSEMIAKARFGSWMNGLRKAGYEGRPQDGARNPNFKEGYVDNYPPIFRRNRQKALERDNYQCQHCGTTSEEHIEKFGWDLVCHHVYPTWVVGESDDKSIHALCNLTMLCESCHGRYEGWFYSPNELLELYGPA